MGIHVTANFPAPGRRGWSVELSDDELADGAVIVFDYGDERELRELRLPEALAAPRELRLLAERIETYGQMADAALGTEGSRVVALAEKLRAEGQGRAGLSGEFLARIVAEKRLHEQSGSPPVATLAREHKVARSTVYRWLRAAEEQGIQ